MTQESTVAPEYNRNDRGNPLVQDFGRRASTQSRMQGHSPKQQQYRCVKGRETAQNNHNPAEGRKAARKPI